MAIVSTILGVVGPLIGHAAMSIAKPVVSTAGKVGLIYAGLKSGFFANAALKLSSGINKVGDTLHNTTMESQTKTAEKGNMLKSFNNTISKAENTAEKAGNKVMEAVTKSTKKVQEEAR